MISFLDKNSVLFDVRNLQIEESLCINGISFRIRLREDDLRRKLILILIEIFIFRHVIICGHITPHSMTTFLRDFLHKDRDQAEELDIVIINKYILVRFNQSHVYLYSQLKENTGD